MLIKQTTERLPQPVIKQEAEPLATPQPDVNASYGEIFGAGMRLENPAVSAWVNRLEGGVDPDFDVFEAIKGTAWENEPDLFVDVHNRADMERLISNVERERKDRDILRQSGWVGVGAEVLGGLTSPSMLLPGGAIVKSAGAGYRAGASALAVGGAALAGVAADEAVLQATQQDRTASETITALAASVVLGGALGGALAGAATRGEKKLIADKMARELAGEDVRGQEAVRAAINDLRAEGASAGAASVDRLSFDDLAIADGPAAAAKVVARLSKNGLMPGLQTMQSESVAVRRVFADLIDQPAYTKANLEGRTSGVSVENSVKYWQRGALGSWLDVRNKQYRQARKEGFKGSRSDFNAEVGRAARRNDEHPIPQVAQAAAELRARVFEPILKRSTIPDDVKTVTAPSFFHRLWNTKAMMAQEPEVKAVFDRYFRGAIKEEIAKAKEYDDANKLVQLEEANATIGRVNSRVASLEKQLGERGAQRNKILSEIAKAEARTRQTREAYLPREFYEAFASADDAVDMVEVVKAANNQVARQNRVAGKPILNLIRKKGGVQIGSPLAQELEARGVNTRTYPGLFRRDGGLGALDNWAWEKEPLFELNAQREGDYISEASLLEGIDAELSGSPWLDEAFDENLDRAATEFVQSLGLPSDAKVSEIRKALERASKAPRAEARAYEAEVNLVADLEKLDTAMDGLRGEVSLTKAKAAEIEKSIAALNESLAHLTDSDMSRPRIRNTVEYARLKRMLGEDRTKRSNLQSRIDDLSRLGDNMTDEQFAELNAARVDADRLNSRIADNEAKAEKIGAYLPKQPMEVADFVSDADYEDYVKELVDTTFNNITGRGKGEVPAWIVPTERGPLKGRTFKIPDMMVEKYLEDDAEIIARRYTRTMGAEIELQAKFGRADMQDQISEIRADYDRLRNEVHADEALSEKQRLKRIEDLRKAEDRDIENLEAWRDMIRGTYRVDEQNSGWGKATRVALAWNYVRLLGGVVLSSAADLARISSVHGLNAAMKEGFGPLVTNMKNVKLAKAEARELGAVVETVLNSRLASLADLNDPYAMGSPFERMMENATSQFTNLTGMTYWNDMLKSVSARLTTNRIIRNALVGDYKKLNKYERQYMAFLGIDEATADEFAAAFSKHGMKDGEVFVTNTDQWDEPLRRRFAAALNKDVDRTIVTKGVADTPLFMQSNAGRLVMQFKSFSLASHSRVLLLGLQERPSRFAGFMIGATAIGMMISWLKMIERDDWERANELVENPGRWVADGLDRTGIFSVPFDVLNTADKVSAAFGGPAFGTSAIGSAIAGDENRDGGSTRYQSRNAAGAILGPTIGIIQDWGAIAAALANGDINKGAANAMVRQVPGGTLPLVRPTIHYGIKPYLLEATGN